MHSNFKTRVPQMSRARVSESHAVNPTASPMDSGGGGNGSITRRKNRRNQLYIGTYNIRTMSTDEHLEELEEELSHIKWNIIGLCETRLPGEKTVTLKSGNVLFQSNSDNNYKNGGVAFIINKKNKYQIIKYRAISERVIYVVMKLTQRYTVQIIQIYAPTTTSNDEEVEQLYEDITRARQQETCHYVIVSGDFNAKLGKGRKDKENDFVGGFGLGERNDRGDKLCEFISGEKLYCLNSFFRKPLQRRWTWISPCKKVKNEIDYILSSHKNIALDVSVLNSFDTGSDHRLVRAKLRFNHGLERTKLVRGTLFPTTQVLSRQRDLFQQELESRLEPTENLNTLDLNSLSEKITLDIQTSTKKICANTRGDKERKLNLETKNLMKQRRQTKKESAEYSHINKKVKKEIRKDIRSYNTKIIQQTIEENANMRVLKTKISRGRQKITNLKNQQGVVVSDRAQIVRVVEEFYRNLYSSSVPEPHTTRTKVLNVGSEEMPEITTDEIRSALQQMKNKKAPGEDRVTSEMLKMGGNALLKALKILLDKCLEEGKIPDRWHNAEVIILFKKGDNKNIENYRPISLLSHMYKLLTKIITNRITTKLDLYQPVEQAGFRSGFSTIDHLQTIKLLIEKANEYNIQLHLAFVDFQKAFDTIETWAVLRALDGARIDYRYSKLIESIYRNATLQVQIDADTKTDKIQINRGVRQGDTISPKLFTAALEDIFKNLQWDDKGIKIDGSYLNHLRFADDVVLISTDYEELTTMLQQLNESSNRFGLKMNLSKTKVISQNNTPIVLDNQEIEVVEHYVYLGHQLKLNKENQTAEITRRIQLSWSAFGRLNYIFKNESLPMCLKRKVYDTCVLPVATYGLETATLTKKSADRLQKSQRAMERRMLGITLRQKVKNEDIRNQTKIIDIMQRIAQMKWQWVGHVARQDRDRWTVRLVHWRPRETKRSRGRPQMRWLDDIRQYAGRHWFRLAQDRGVWRARGEAYVQQWTDTG